MKCVCLANSELRRGSSLSSQTWSRHQFAFSANSFGPAIISDGVDSGDLQEDGRLPSGQVLAFVGAESISKDVRHDGRIDKLYCNTCPVSPTRTSSSTLCAVHTMTAWYSRVDSDPDRLYDNNVAPERQKARTALSC